METVSGSKIWKAHTSLVMVQVLSGGYHVISKLVLDVGINQIVYCVFRDLIAFLILAPIAYIHERFFFSISLTFFMHFNIWNWLRFHIPLFASIFVSEWSITTTKSSIILLSNRIVRCVHYHNTCDDPFPPTPVKFVRLFCCLFFLIACHR